MRCVAEAARSAAGQRKEATQATQRIESEERRQRVTKGGERGKELAGFSHIP
jgi:hypothetical protein